MKDWLMGYEEKVVPLTRKLGAIGRGLHVQGVSLVAEAVKDPVTAVEMASQSLAGAVDEDGGICAVARGKCGDCGLMLD